MTSDVPYSSIINPQSDVRLPGNLDLFKIPYCSTAIIDHYTERIVPTEPWEFERDLYTFNVPMRYFGLFYFMNNNKLGVFSALAMSTQCYLAQ